MAYLALYRKWRPQSFADVVGQHHISDTLSRAVAQGKLAHAYLFSGPRGTGKTSMARILAKAVNCENGPAAEPCNHCRICEEISRGACLDVYEIDAASNRGIEDIRGLKESVQNLPSSCRKKVYIIDEVHMLTKEAFNALLKTLEEPPEHVLFILATTEPEKIPLTILSRCQRYEFHRISIEDISTHLMDIAKKSGISLRKDAADLIAVRSEGGLRDALSLLDQASGAADGKILDAALVYDLLGLTGKDRILHLAEEILARKSSAVLSSFYAILQDGKEPQAVLRDLLEHFRNIMLCKVNPKAPELSVYGNNLEALRKEAGAVTEDYADALFSSLHQSLSETKRSASPRMNAEMGLLRLCRLEGTQTVEGLLARVKKLEEEMHALSSGAVPKNTPSFPVSPQPVPLPPPARPAAPAAKTAPEEPAPQGATPFEDIPLPEEEASFAAPPPAPVPSLPPEETAPLKAAAPRRPAATALQPLPDRGTPPLSGEPRPPRPVLEDKEPSGEIILDPASYEEIWKKVLDYFMAIHRLDILMCFKKSRLIYASRTRAVVAAPQQFLLLAANNKSYQKVAAEGFKKATGYAVVPRTVLTGTADESQAAAEAASYRRAPSSGAQPSSPKEVKDDRPPAASDEGYRKISLEEIPQADRKEAALSEALKFLPGCDIYEKTDENRL